jgi:hydrogenase nickel incorporation protein HypB
MTSEPRLLEVRKNVLKQNDVLARALRNRFQAQSTFVVSLVSSPGTGKTTLLERTLTFFKQQHRVAALVGDLATENDAQRLARSGAPVKQITTGTVCHLEAAMVERALQGWDVGQIDLLFIENVGNLVCPASYDLGEDLRLVMLSVTEGEDKPLKYPTIFNSADAAVVTKCDLSAAVEFDELTAVANIRAVRPEMPVFLVSAKSGKGMDNFLQFVTQRMHRKRSDAVVTSPAEVTLNRI